MMFRIRDTSRAATSSFSPRLGHVIMSLLLAATFSLDILANFGNGRGGNGERSALGPILFAEAANGGGDTVAHRHYLPAKDLLTMTVTGVTNCPGNGVFNHQMALDSVHGVFYVGGFNMRTVQRYTIATGLWQLMRQAPSGVEYVAMCVTANGRTLYMGQYQPSAMIQKLTHASPWSYSSTIALPFINIAGGGSISNPFSAGYGTNARFGQMWSIRIRGDLIVGAHQSCVYQVDLANSNLVTQYVCDCSGTPATVDGVNNTAKCNNPKGITWNADGTILYMQESLTTARWIRKIFSTGSPENPETSIASLDQGPAGAGWIGMMVHPFFENVTMSFGSGSGMDLYINGKWFHRPSSTTQVFDVPFSQAVVYRPIGGEIYDKDGSIWLSSRDTGGALGAAVYRICCLWTQGGSLVHYTEPSRHGKMSVTGQQYTSTNSYGPIVYSPPLQKVFTGGTALVSVKGENGNWNQWSSLASVTSDSMVVTPDGTKIYYSAIGGPEVGSRNVDGTGFARLMGTSGSATFVAGGGALAGDTARLGGFSSMAIAQDYVIVADPNTNNCLGTYTTATAQLAHLACAIGSAGSADGLAATATCNQPLAVAYEGISGSVFFSQQNNGNGRKVTPQGYVVTFRSGTSSYIKANVPHPMFAGFGYGTFSSTSSTTYGGYAGGVNPAYLWNVASAWTPATHLFLGRPFDSSTQFYRTEQVALDTDNGAIWISAKGEGVTYRICCLWENATTTYTAPFALESMVTYEASNIAQLPMRPNSAEYGFGTGDGQFYLWIYRTSDSLQKIDLKSGSTSMIMSNTGSSVWTDAWPRCFTVQQDASVFLGYTGYITKIGATGPFTTGIETIAAKGSSAGTWIKGNSAGGTGPAAVVGLISSLTTIHQKVLYLDTHNRMIGWFQIGGVTNLDVTLVGCSPRITGTDVVDGLAEDAMCTATMDFATSSHDGYFVYWMEKSGITSGSGNLNLVRKLVFASEDQSLGQIVTVYNAASLVGSNAVRSMFRHPFYPDIFFVMMDTDLLLCRDNQVVQLKLEVGKSLQQAVTPIDGKGPMVLDTFRGVIYVIKATKVYEIRSLWDGERTPTEQPTVTGTPTVEPTPTATRTSTVTSTTSANNTLTEEGTLTPSVSTTQSISKTEGRTASLTRSPGTQSPTPTTTLNETETGSFSQGTNSASSSESKTPTATHAETESATHRTRSATKSAATLSTSLTHDKTLSSGRTQSAEQNSTTASRSVDKDRTRTLTPPPASPCVGLAVPTPMAESSLASQRLAEAQLRAGTTKLVYGPLSYAAQWQGQIRDGADIPKAFVQLLLVRTQGEQPNPGGFLKYPQSSFNLTRLNASYFSLSLERDAGFSVEEDESALLVLSPSYFPFCPPSADIPLVAISIEAAPTAAVVATKKAAEVVSGAATVASLAGSSGAALDAQSLAVIGLMSCAQPAERGALKNNRLLSPLATGDTYEGMIAGNWILIAVVLILHSGVACILKMVKKLSHVEAQVLVKFPTLSLVAITVQYQGTASACVKLLQSRPGPASIVLGVFTIAVTFCIPIGLFLLARKVITAKFHNYAFDAPHLEKRFHKIAQLLMPQGRWWPVDMRKRYSSLFAGLRRPEKFWVTFPTWSPTVIVVGLMFEPSTSTACVAQFAVMSAMQFVFVVVVLGFRPYRSIIANLLAAASNMCLGFVLAGSAMLATDPESSTALMFMLRGVQAQMAITLFRLLWSGIQFALEHSILKPVPMEELHGWEGTDEIERKRREAEKQQQGQEGDESMQILSDALLPPLPPAASALSDPKPIDPGQDENPVEVQADPRRSSTNKVFGIGAGDLGDDILSAADTRDEEAAPTLTNQDDLEELAELMRKKEMEDEEAERRKDKNYDPDSLINQLMTTRKSKRAPVVIHDQILASRGESTAGDLAPSTQAALSAFLRGTSEARWSHAGGTTPSQVPKPAPEAKKSKYMTAAELGDDDGIDFL